MPHPYFYRAALVGALLPSVFGLNALLRPEAALRSVQFPVPSDPEGRKLTRSLMRIYGIRNVGISYLLTLIWSTGDEKLMGLGLLTGIAMAVTDGFVSRVQIGGGEWNHWSFVPACGGVIAELLGWFN